MLPLLLRLVMAGSAGSNKEVLQPSLTFKLPFPPLFSGWLCRQAERRSDIKEVLQHWGYGRTVDMSPFEAEGQYFEGTVRPKKLYC